MRRIVVRFDRATVARLDALLPHWPDASRAALVRAFTLFGLSRRGGECHASGRGRPVTADRVPARLDFSDAVAVTEWLRNIRVAIDDAESITVDMLRPLRKRELGPRLHREQFREARKALQLLLDCADPPLPEPKPGDPAGCGGTPAH